MSALEDRVLAAARELSPRGRAGTLADLRGALPDVSRTDMDAALMDLHRKQLVQLDQQPFSWRTTDDHRAAAIQLGGEEMTLFAAPTPESTPMPSGGSGGVPEVSFRITTPDGRVNASGGMGDTDKYVVEMTNNNGDRVPITQVPLRADDARALAERMRKQLPEGSSASFSVRSAHASEGQEDSSMGGMFKSVGGEGQSVWPRPIGNEAEDAVRAFEEIRARAVALSQWCLDEISANNIHAKISQGMTSQAHIRSEAANAVAGEIVRLMLLIQDHANSLAAVAKLAGTKVVTMYEEPIREARAHGRASSSTGLKVN